jgi:uncharacterized membrane protein YdbT with pleckstrin-like domain
MYELLKRITLAVLKVPPEPDAPAGDQASLQVFRASKDYYRYRFYVWLFSRFVLTLMLGIPAVGMAIGAVALLTRGEAVGGFLLAFVGLVMGTLLLVQTAFGYAALRLDYEMRWYKVTDRSLRIREGVYHVREMTLTFANIQNISISQGPLQRFFGISDLQVQTAGGGGMVAAQQGHQFGMHTGYFRGVDNAEEIRELMMTRLKLARDAGLGDEKVEQARRGESRGGGWGPHTVQALRELAAEATALRQSATA